MDAYVEKPTFSLMVPRCFYADVARRQAAIQMLKPKDMFLDHRFQGFAGFGAVKI